MTNLSQLPSDYKKYLDQTLYHYLPKLGVVRNTFNVIDGDTADTTYEYVRQTQSYAAATGFTSLDAPQQLAEGARPEVDSIGTEDATASPVTYAKAFHVDRKLLSSNKPIAKNLIQQHAIGQVQRIETDVNNTLITNMLSNASQTYSASNTWSSSSGDPFGDLTSATMAFKDSSGGIEPDFVILHTNEAADLRQDDRWVNRDYTEGRPADTGSWNNPLGLNLIIDTGCTTGSFVLGKKGMFGSLFETEKFLTTETDEGLAGKKFEIAYTYIDAYQLPYLLMAGTGI